MEAMKGKRITMTALERQLLDAQEGEAHRQRLMEKILQKRRELGTLMKAGAPAAEYRAWNEFSQALDSALKVLEEFR